MYYTFKSRVRYSECGRDGRLSLTDMINYFQDCSVFQSEYVGQGVEKLEEEGKIWVLSSWKLEIDQVPALGDEIEVGTFAVGFRGFYGFRNFFMKDADGNYLVKVYSIWTFLDTKTGHPAKVGEKDVEAYGVEPELPMKDKSRKIPAPEPDARVEKKEPVE
ncbi:MAG: thioesterase, partial [Agathobacter sp.]|nr:thioesterase [Lachnospiraceae bacterium]MDY2620465.1 thioesterase [Agathobacter sp.]